MRKTKEVFKQNQLKLFTFSACGKISYISWQNQKTFLLKMIAKISIQSTFIQANAVNNTPLENPITPIHAFRQKLDFLNEGVIIGIVFFQDK